MGAFLGISGSNVSLTVPTYGECWDRGCPQVITPRSDECRALRRRLAALCHLDAALAAVNHEWRPVGNVSLRCRNAEDDLNARVRGCRCTA
jgi:hypothetical protein